MEMPQWLGIKVPPGSESRACAHEGFPGTWEARCFPPPNYRYRKDRTRTFQACGGGVDPLQERRYRHGGGTAVRRERSVVGRGNGSRNAA